MPEAITNTSPMLYLYRIGVLDWLPQLCDDIWIPRAVVDELQDGRRRGYDVPIPSAYTWLQVVEPRVVPSEWLALDLGAGELAVLAIALDHPQRVILLDDGRARRIAQAAGLTIWGTLKILLEAKSQALTDLISPHLDRLRDADMWMSEAIRQRVLVQNQVLIEGYRRFSRIRASAVVKRQLTLTAFALRRSSHAAISSRSVS